MEDGMEKKEGVLPFSFGCVSQTSVAVGEVQSKKVMQENEKDKERVSMAKMKKNSIVFRAPKSIFIGFWRFVKGIKNFPQWLAYREDEVEEEKEMEIGYPTDVKHVAHIGWDGSTTTATSLKSWNNFEPHDLLSLHSISLRQFELTMAAQAATSLNV